MYVTRIEKTTSLDLGAGDIDINNVMDAHNISINLKSTLNNQGEQNTI